MPGHPPPDTVVETHVSRLVFLGDRVYKLKKPVQFAFLDFSHRAARREACHREVQLNRRLSPDVYLGVLDVVGADGRTVDHLVEMRRMPPGRRLATLVRDDAPGLADCIRQVAHRLASFHAGASRGSAIDEDASHAAATAGWEADLAELDHLVADAGGPVDRTVLDEVAWRARAWMAGRAPVFDERIAAGRAVDGHGDLLAEDIFCLDDGPRILDCIEFDDHLRHVDVWDDVAFLAMDLERLGRPDVADLLVGTYRDLSADTAPAGLVEQYIAHRALVRAKVAALRSLQTPDGDARRSVEAEARDRLEQCRRHLRHATVRLVLVGGLPGRGKSTTADGLAERLDAWVLSSDPLRKELVGAPSTASVAAAPGQGAYGDDVTDRTYRALLDRARVGLERGGSVVLDASWTRERHRAAARRLADEAGAELVQLECRCDPALAVERLAARALDEAQESDADASVAEHLAALAEPWPDALTLDTTPVPDEVVAHAVGLVLGPSGGSVARRPTTSGSSERAAGV